MPEVAAAEVLALRTEWALKISVSTPALFSKDLSHLAIVDEDTGLWGLFMLRNNVECDPGRRSVGFICS